VRVLPDNKVINQGERNSISFWRYKGWGRSLGEREIFTSGSMISPLSSFAGSPLTMSKRN
jgi:hypothetical protein